MSGFVLIFYGKIFEIVKFDPLEDILHLDTLLDLTLNLSNEPISIKAEALGYPSRYAISNLGALFVYFILSLLLLLLFVAIIKIANMMGLNKGKVLLFLKQ